MTAQFGNAFNYDGQEMSMCTHPLGDYFALGGINPGFGQEWPLDCTALWRGYIGTWEVLGDRLYLVAIHKLVLNGPGTNFLETVFSRLPRSRICALVFGHASDTPREYFEICAHGLPKHL